MVYLNGLQHAIDSYQTGLSLASASLQLMHQSGYPQAQPHDRLMHIGQLQRSAMHMLHSMQSLRPTWNRSGCHAGGGRLQCIGA